MVAPMLMHNYTDATAAGQALIAAQFAVVLQVLWRAIWQYLDTILLAAWWLGIGWLLLADRPRLSRRCPRRAKSLSLLKFSRPARRRLAAGHMGCYAAISWLAVASDYVIAQRRPAVLVFTKLPSLRVQSPRHDPASRCVRTSPTGLVLGFLGVVSCRRSPTEPGPLGC